MKKVTSLLLSFMILVMSLSVGIDKDSISFTKYQNGVPVPLGAAERVRKLYADILYIPNDNKYRATR